MGSHPYSQHSSFITGVAVSEDEGWIVRAMDHLVERDQENAVFLYLKGSDLEAKHAVDFNTKFAGVLTGQGNDLIAVGEDGNVVVISQSGPVSEDVITIDGTTPGPLTRGLIVDGQVVMAGMGGHVYRREPTGMWVTMEDGLPSGRKALTGFWGIAGDSLSRLYAVGFGGAAWKYDGSKWHAMPQPTRDILTAVCVADDHSVYAVGQAGELYRATDDSWEKLESECYDDLWSVTCFNGETYAASLYHLYRLNQAGVLAAIDPLGCPCYGPFTACSQALWTIGQKAVLSYNRKEWVQLA